MPQTEPGAGLVDDTEAMLQQWSTLCLASRPLCLGCTANYPQARSRLLLQVFQQLLTREFSCDAVYQVDKESPCILAAYHGVGALACEAIHRRIIVFSDDIGRASCRERVCQYV